MSPRIGVCLGIIMCLIGMPHGHAGPKKTVDSSMKTYKSFSTVYPIVSAGNCKMAETGERFGCQFPEINLSSESKIFPPVPYETKMQVKSSIQCRSQIESSSAALKIQLRLFPEFVGQDDFFRNEDFAFNQYGIRLLYSPGQQPFKQIVIAPKSLEIFENTSFPEGCEIGLHIALNRIAIRTHSEAQAYMVQLDEQLQLLQQSVFSLIAFNEGRTERRQTFHLKSMRQRIVRKNGKLKACGAQWENLKKLIPALEKNITRNRTLAADPVLRTLIFEMSDFSRLFTQTLATGTFAPADWDELISRFQGQRIGPNGVLVANLLKPKALLHARQKFKKMQFLVEMARRSFNLIFEKDDYPGFLEDLSDVFTQEIVGPQGAIDRMLHGLRNIAPPQIQELK